MGGADDDTSSISAYITAAFDNSLCVGGLVINSSDIRRKKLMILIMMEHYNKYYQFNQKHINMWLVFSLSISSAVLSINEHNSTFYP